MVVQRRSKDGYVSATGMFKIAFPWAKLEEEKAEREYLKSRKETSQDEIAGNVWITPELGTPIRQFYARPDVSQVHHLLIFVQHWNFPRSIACTTGSAPY